MTPEQGSQWREEFERLIKYKGTIRFSGGTYADNRLHQKWIGFQTAKRRDQKRVASLKEELDEMTQDRNRIHEDRFKLVQEIEQLKEELMRERDTVDFYASSESWNYSGYATYTERHFAKISEKMKIDYDDAENYPVSIIGGRLARQTQQQRRIEL